MGELNVVFVKCLLNLFVDFFMYVKLFVGFGCEFIVDYDVDVVDI